MAVDTWWTLLIAMTCVVSRLFGTRYCAELCFGNLPSPSEKHYKTGITVATRCIRLRSVSKMLRCRKVRGMAQSGSASALGAEGTDSKAV